MQPDKENSSSYQRTKDIQKEMADIHGTGENRRMLHKIEIYLSETKGQK